MSITLGYDIGGAHLKVARVENGRVTAVRQIACPLWQGLDRLDEALAAAEPLRRGAERHALTMTAELTEIFDSRAAGVATLLETLSRRISPDARVFMGLKGFGSVGDAKRDPQAVASANFLATARLVASRMRGALLIDMGSTTTDIVLCDRPQGLSDAERLQTGELVYTGYTRTSVPSVTTRAPLLGSWQALARDNFATMGDVRRILAELPDDVDVHATADGRGTSLRESLVRFSRGFGRDGEERHLAGWRVAAAHVREHQLRSIYDGAIQVLSRPGTDVSGGVIAAGIGASVADVIACRLGLTCATFASVVDAPAELSTWTTRCAPAVAIALLASAGD